MDFLDLIENQRLVNRLPIVAVTIAAVPHVNTPVILALHWHGFVGVPIVPGGQPVAFEPVQSSVLQVTAPWDSCDDLENSILEAAWEMGAWSLERTQAAPFQRPGADAAETTAAWNAFGKSDVLLCEQSPFVAEAPDADDLLETAARSGYVQWLFRPVRGGLWPVASADITLEEDGHREPTCPLLGKPLADVRQCKTARREVYPLGKSIRLLH